MLKEEFIDLQLENLDLVSDQEDSDIEASGSDLNFLSTCKTGTRYSPKVRKLYYKLLADQVPASKIADIIRSVLKCFHHFHGCPRAETTPENMC